MNRIAQILPSSHVVLDLEASSKARLFEVAGQLFEGTLGVTPASVAASLAAREKLGSTGLGQGIAIPHGRIKGLRRAAGAYARLATPIEFEAPDGKPVGQVFVLLVPEQATEEHLQLLSELAQMFSERRFREQLAAAAGASDIVQLFATWNPNP